MGKTFASGKKALGICDRCGFQYKLKELSGETRNKNRVNNKVCCECLDPDHPQTWLGRAKFEDAQALRDPRVDTGRIPGNAMFNFNPVADFDLTVQLGNLVW